MIKELLSREHRPTLFLKGVLVLFAGLALVLCYFLLPAVLREWVESYPEISYGRLPMFFALSLSAVAFLIALVQAFKLLTYIDTNQAFSDVSVKALKRIAICGIAIGVMFAAISPIMYLMAQHEDAPGLGLLDALITFASFVIATFAAVLQKVLKSAIALKKENDLTV